MTGAVRFRLLRGPALAAAVVAALVGPVVAQGQDPGRRSAEARELTRLGEEAFRAGKAAEAIAYHTDALAIYRALGRPADQAASLAAVGDVLAYLFNYEAAIPKYEEALRLLGAANGEPLRARLKLALGKAQMMLGRREDAIRHLEEALRSFQALGDGDRAAEARGRLDRLR